MQLRDVVPDDTDDVSAFFAGLTPEARTFFWADITDPTVAAAWVRDDRRAPMVVVDDGRIVAFGALVPLSEWSSHVAELVLVVASDARRQGRGRALANAMLLAALKRGFTKVTVEVAADQPGAMAMFQAIGFQAEALLRDHLRTPETGQKRDLVILAHHVEETYSHMLAAGLGGGHAMISEASEELIRFGDTEILVRATGNGQPILLINGIGAHTAMWSVLESTLTGFRVLSFDAPGTGRSSSSCGVTSVRQLAKLAAQVLDHFEVDQADVLGYSMGGIVLQQMCADFPQRVRRAALVATTPGLGAVYGSTLSMLNVSTPLRYLNDDLYRRTIGQLAGGRARTDTSWVDQHGEVRLRYRPSIRGYSKQVMALAGWSGLPLLREIRTPTLVVTGDDDPLTPVVNSMMMAHLLPEGRLVVIPGEGHLMLLDDHSAVHKKVREYFETEDLTTAPVWLAAGRVDDRQMKTALSGKSLQIQPWPWAPVGSYLRHRCLNNPPTRRGAD